MKWPVPKQEVCTHENGVIKGESIEQKRRTTKYEHSSSLYADDTVLFCNSRGDLEKGASCLYAHLLKYGLTMHIGTGATPSKTEAMYFPPLRRLYSDADIARLDALFYLENLDGFIDFTSVKSNTLIRSSIIL
jgi:hypothetical protein